MATTKSCFVALLSIALMVSYTSATAQRQMVLVSGNEVVHRFRVGEALRTKLDYDRKEHWGFLVKIDEFSVITSQDTIDLRKIKKVLLPFKSFGQKTGNKLVQAGILLFVGDQVNNSLIQGNDFSVNSGVSIASAALVIVGIPMILKKNWAKPKGALKLVSVGRESILYQPDL